MVISYMQLESISAFTKSFYKAFRVAFIGWEKWIPIDPCIVSPQLYSNFQLEIILKL